MRVALNSPSRVVTLQPTPGVSRQNRVPGNAQRRTGLTSAKAAAKLAALGPNELARAQAASPWKILASQFGSPVIWLLLAACLVSALLGETADAVAIGVIVVINGLVGFFQEYRAERAVIALRSMTAPRARVLRDGQPVIIPARDVVTEDVLLLEAGDLVAADATVLEANALTVNESLLTGESMPVEKVVEPAAAEAPLAERRDTVFTGTAVSNGTGIAEVVAIGMDTELGKIAHLLTSVEDTDTPLEKQLARVSQTLLYLCVGVVGVVAVAGFLRGTHLLDVFLSAVSLAVAAVPEGLPAVVTIALAIGVQRMASRHVLVRKLQAVETLGSANVICTDKTGTLTTGVMAVRELWGPDHQKVLDAATACSEASLNQDERDGVGDPTEIAILLAASERGIRRDDIERSRPRTAVHPFDSERKMMSIRRADGVLYVKGAVEIVLARCIAGTEGAAESNVQMAARGLRVLAVATGATDEERDLRLLGLIGIADPPRTEAIEAVTAARGAGIETVMITGDHPTTARAIAWELGILRPGKAPEEFVHARASPEDKLRIVRSWKTKGAVVAMTGDGVNDAPALREAHIGIAMGRSGTEVTREASDMILTDDNFASIVAAVREGRGIFDNIQKTLVYLLSGNSAELLVMLLAAVFGLPLPLLPIQLLWVNLATDGFPALALVADPVSPDALKRPPRRPNEPILGRSEWLSIAFTGVVQTATTLGTFVWALRSRNLEEARNLAFTVLVFGELFRAFAARSPTRLFWETGAFKNLALLGVVLASVLIQLGIHHIPATRSIFRIGAISLSDCILSLVIGLLPVTFVECGKLVRRRSSNAAAARAR